jgi:LacI family transcriptional regulator
MKSRKSSATIEDVAREAGVSIATVSRVINASGVVTPDTVHRVQKIIQKLNYVPRTAARILARRRTDTIGFLLPDISGAFFPLLLRGIDAGAREAGYDLLIHTTQPHPGQAVHRKLGEHNTDGLIIFCGSIPEDELFYWYQLGLPLILLHQTPPANANIPFVSIENKNGALKLIQHLIVHHQKKRIVFLKGPQEHEDSLWRERGYRLALRQHNIPFDPSLMIFGGFDETIAYHSTLQWLSQDLKFDAIFCGDDDAAIGVMRALRQVGKQIPEDVLVVGFDDVPISRYLDPPLTTVRSPIEQVGREAVRQLIRLIRDGHADQEVLFPTELVIRRSCGCNPT